MSAAGKRVAVLKGGWSAEREVSLVSGREVAKALREEGYDAYEVDVTRDLDRLLAALTPRPDVVFNALHGRGGEDGTIQGVLEFLRLPTPTRAFSPRPSRWTSPPPRRSSPPPGCRSRRGSSCAAPRLAAPGIPMPFVVKPANEGSSVGVRIVRENDNSWAEEAPNWPYEESLVEEFVPGRELTCAVMGDRCLGVLEIRARAGAFYDYDSKYAPGGSEHLMPAPIHAEAYEQVCAVSLAAHKALGCRGVSRADFRYDDTKGEPGRVVLLEVNTQPGMTPTSLVPDIARHQGIGYGALVRWIVENAALDP